MPYDLNSGHGRVAIHGDKIQKQFSLRIRFQAIEFADQHIGLACFPCEIETLEQGFTVAENVEDVGDIILSFVTV